MAKLPAEIREANQLLQDLHHYDEELATLEGQKKSRIAGYYKSAEISFGNVRFRADADVGLPEFQRIVAVLEALHQEKRDAARARLDELGVNWQHEDPGEVPEAKAGQGDQHDSEAMHVLETEG